MDKDKPNKETGVRKITMTVFCLEEDEQDVMKSLCSPAPGQPMESGSGGGWFYENDFPLAKITLKSEISNELTRDDI